MKVDDHGDNNRKNRSETSGRFTAAQGILLDGR